MDQTPQPSKFNASRDFPQHLAVWCEADEALSKGDACFCAGYSGGVRHMVKADADTPAHVAGDLLYAGYDMPAGRRGNFYPWLILTGLDTSAYTQGDRLYLSSTAGGYASTNASARERAIGQVLEADATEGVVLLGAQVAAKAGVLTLSAAASTGSLTTPNNAWPLNLFALETPTGITVPYSGDWLVELTVSVARDAGAVGGTALQQSLLFCFYVDGVLRGDSIANEVATANFTRSYVLRQVLTLAAGEVVTAQWGFGAAQVAGVTGGASRVLSLTPVR